MTMQNYYFFLVSQTICKEKCRLFENNYNRKVGIDKKNHEFVGQIHGYY
jgi:hypothetical protein